MFYKGKAIEKIGEKEFFKFIPHLRDWNYHNPGKQIFIPSDLIGSKKQFSPVDQHGNELKNVNCEFEGQGTCKISFNRGQDVFHHTPDVLFCKGAKKSNVNDRLVKSLSKSILDVRNKLQSALDIVTNKYSVMASELASLFVPVEKTNLTISGVSEQIESLKLRIKDCERLEELCR